MFNEVGKKIKGLAKGLFVVEAIGAVIAGIGVISEGGDSVIIGLLTMIIGPAVAWVCALLLYGFGELIDKVCDIEESTHGIKTKTSKETKSIETPKDTSKLDKLLAQGLITEEEYQKAISRKQREVDHASTVII